MRFITEFEFTDNEWSGMTEANFKANCKLQLGVDIAERFGWQNPANGNPRHHRLEIEAFPMDKWVEFKQKLFSEINQSQVHDGHINEVKILEFVKALESFCKPAV